MPIGSRPGARARAAGGRHESSTVTPAPASLRAGRGGGAQGGPALSSARHSPRDRRLPKSTHGGGSPGRVTNISQAELVTQLIGPWPGVGGFLGPVQIDRHKSEERKPLCNLAANDASSQSRFCLSRVLCKRLYAGFVGPVSSFRCDLSFIDSPNGPSRWQWYQDGRGTGPPQIPCDAIEFSPICPKNSSLHRHLNRWLTFLRSHPT